MTYVLPSHNPSTGVTAPSSWGDDINSDLTFLNNAFHVELFPRSSGRVDANVAGMLYSTGTGAAGTPQVEFPILQANGASLSARKWIASAPPAYGGSLYVRGNYYMPVAGTANFVLGVRVAALGVGGTVTAKAFASQTLGTITASTFVGALTAFSVTPASLDSLVAGLPVTIELSRLPANAGDGEAGTLCFTNIDAYFSLSA